MVFNPGDISGFIFEEEDKELGKFKSKWEYEGGMLSTSQVTHTPWVMSPIPIILPMVPGPYIQPGSLHGFQTCISSCLLGDSDIPDSINTASPLPGLLLFPYSLYHHLPRHKLESWEPSLTLSNHPLNPQCLIIKSY